MSSSDFIVYPIAVMTKAIRQYPNVSSPAAMARGNEPSLVSRDSLQTSLDCVKVLQGLRWTNRARHDSRSLGTASFKLGRVVEDAVGAGLEGHVAEAYNFIALDWSSGDQIFCLASREVRTWQEQSPALCPTLNSGRLGI